MPDGQHTEYLLIVHWTNEHALVRRVDIHRLTLPADPARGAELEWLITHQALPQIRHRTAGGERVEAAHFLKLRAPDDGGDGVGVEIERLGFHLPTFAQDEPRGYEEVVAQPMH